MNIFESNGVELELVKYNGDMRSNQDNTFKKLSFAEKERYVNMVIDHYTAPMIEEIKGFLGNLSKDNIDEFHRLNNILDKTVKEIWNSYV